MNSTEPPDKLPEQVVKTEEELQLDELSRLPNNLIFESGDCPSDIRCIKLRLEDVVFDEQVKLLMQEAAENVQKIRIHASRLFKLIDMQKRLNGTYFPLSEKVWFQLINGQ